MKKSFWTILAAVVLSCIAAYIVAKTVVPDNAQVSTVKSYPTASYRTVNLELDDYPDFTFAAESAVDAVVYVKVSARDNRRAPSSILEYFFGFGGDNSQPREVVGSGSGVIIREDGYIVTNNHVIDGATKIEVTLNSNKTFAATLVGTDPATDVALIKIDAEGLPVIPFGDSDKLRLGEWVLAIGSPYDLRSTITAGIVSAKGRSMPNYTGEFKIESFIQTDAAVNPGNSGGALVDKSGHLVGINTAIISQTGSYTGYSFAVPSNIVHKIVDDLIDFGSVKRAILGVTMQEIDEKKAEELKLSSMDGVYVYEVSKGSAADEAGIKKGDVIVAIDSMKVTTGSSVQAKVNTYHPGDKADITFIRDGKEKTVNVKFKAADTVVENGTVDESGDVAFYGGKLHEADSEKLEHLNLSKGVEVVSAGTGKLNDAGVEDGFIILYVNDQPVGKPQDVIDIAKKQKRTVVLDGVKANGKAAYYVFGVE
ncbi:MAG: Do family serine endopeptidase [Bacteroidales bacterium]|nr:Do family serine endopeptidase [Bacteroidales bacterium]